jgi:hypothetical protein
MYFQTQAMTGTNLMIATHSQVTVCLAPVPDALYDRAFSEAAEDLMAGVTAKMLWSMPMLKRHLNIQLSTHQSYLMLSMLCTKSLLRMERSLPPTLKRRRLLGFHLATTFRLTQMRTTTTPGEEILAIPPSSLDRIVDPVIYQLPMDDLPMMMRNMEEFDRAMAWRAQAPHLYQPVPRVDTSGIPSIPMHGAGHVAAAARSVIVIPTTVTTTQPVNPATTVAAQHPAPLFDL